MKSTGKSRPFCVEMMKLSDNNLVWRIEDIDNASWGKLEKDKDGKSRRVDQEVNVEFRHRPDLPYDIFTLKGGIYCQHKWVRVLYRLKDKTKVRGENLKNYKEVGIENFPKYMIRKKPKGTADSEKPTDEMDGRGAYPK